MSALPPLTSTSLAALLTATNAFTGLTINGLGDSIIGAQSLYSQYNDPTYQSQIANNIPTWASLQAAGASVPVYTLCKSGSPALVYHCTTAGVPGSTAPSGTARTAVSDGGASWIFDPSSNVQKSGTSMLTWAEAFSGGRLSFDMTLGYGGVANSLTKVIVVSGGSGYANGDAFVGSYGATGTLIVSGGKVTGVTITNPGFSVAGFSYGITTSTGTGAVLSLIQGGSGTWRVPGCYTSDMVARLPDVLASPPSILVVHGGTNDGPNGIPATTTINNLQTCYEAAMLAGIKVCAIPILPSATTAHQSVASRFHAQRVNRWIRAYCRGAKWANPKGFKAIVLADPTPIMLDGTNGSFYPIGGLGGVLNAGTQDGLHPAHRFAQYLGYAIFNACQLLIGSAPAFPSRTCSADDGFDPLLNPGGCLFEGVAWQASYAYVLGQQCSNGGNVYRCLTGGTSASSGGPTGTSASITDGSVTWAYMNPAKVSTFGAGTAGTLTAVSGVTSGTVATGCLLARGGGSATGSVVASVESPWSNGQVGQRQRIQFSLGGGTNIEIWNFFLSPQYPQISTRNVQASEINSVLFEAEVELELTNVANMNGCYLNPFTDGSNGGVTTGPYLNLVGEEMMASATDQLCVALGGVYPNNGKLLLRSAPFYLPPNVGLTTAFPFGVVFSFNASGAAGSATANVAVNFWSLRRYGVA